jgi:hypothetical protein
VNEDRSVPIDALIIINFLNRNGEGEQSAKMPGEFDGIPIDDFIEAEKRRKALERDSFFRNYQRG